MRERRYQSRGFTLIEVMIVVVIVAILSSIALPAYNEYIRRSHRSDARAGLLQAAQWMERAATANGVYPTELPAALTWSADASKRYTIGFASSNTNASYTLRAVPKSPGPQAADKCGTYTLAHNGKQGNEDLGSDVSIRDCWGR